MKFINITFVGLMTMLIVVACEPQQISEDVVTTHEANADVKFENEYVRAVEFTLKPGELLPLHKGGERVIYSLSDYKIKWTEGGQVNEREWRAGEAHWHDAIDHAAENIGNNDARYLVVTRTEVALPETAAYDIEKDASRVDSMHAGIVFDNEYVRIIEVNLAEGESQPTHHGINRLIYPLTSYQIKFVSDLVGTKETNMNAGSMHWHSADEHSVENTGDTLARYIIFAFKN